MPSFVAVYTAEANYFIFDAFLGNNFAANDDAENAAPVNAAVYDATKANAATANESHLSFLAYCMGRFMLDNLLFVLIFVE